MKIQVSSLFKKRWLFPLFCIGFLGFLLPENVIHSYSQNQSKPNVIIVMTDDQGYGDMSCHGNPILKTPNLDELYSHSIRFTDFHVAPVCTPTRGQLLTGRDAMHNGAWSLAYGNEMIHPGNETMADIFKANGYATGHFGKWHLGDNYPYRPVDKGFQKSVSFGGAATHQSPDYWQNDSFDDFYRHEDGKYNQHKGYCTDVWFKLSMDFMHRCVQDEKPFFIYLPTNISHAPYYVSEEYAENFPPHSNGNVQKLFGMLANFDENMGRLNEFMKLSSLWENTILIYLTDNGVSKAGLEIYNAGMRGKKGSYYDGGHRTPCFFQYPEGQLGKPRDIKELVQVQDILPTLIDICQLKVNKQTKDKFDGTSLAGLLSGESEKLADRKLVVQWSYEESPKYGEAAVLWEKWRLVNNEELYNIVSDSGQEKDIASEYPEIVKVLQRHYADWWKTTQSVTSIDSRIYVGGAEKPTRLCCFDWHERTGNGNIVTQITLWRGPNVNGIWKLYAEKEGRYRFKLRRYPEEANFPMSGAYPKTKREFKTFEECKALPIMQARLKIGNYDDTIPVKTLDNAAIFEVDLPIGEFDMKTWLLDKAANELCGAYYVDVELISSRLEIL